MGEEARGRNAEKMSGYADVLITNMGQAEDVYGIADETEEETAKLLAREYGCRYVALNEAKDAYGLEAGIRRNVECRKGGGIVRGRTR